MLIGGRLVWVYEVSTIQYSHFMVTIRQKIPGQDRDFSGIGNDDCVGTIEVWISGVGFSSSERPFEAGSDEEIRDITPSPKDQSTHLNHCLS